MVVFIRIIVYAYILFRRLGVINQYCFMKGAKVIITALTLLASVACCGKSRQTVRQVK